jgi:AcrR family transcriptional regulator
VHVSVRSRLALSGVGSRSDAANRLRASALELFYRHGYGATSVRDIAAAAGVTPGAVYNHFNSKHEILYSIVTSTHEALDQYLFNAVADSGTEPGAQLHAAVAAFVRYNCLHPDEARVTNRDFRHLPPELLGHELIRRRQTRDLFANILARGNQMGVLGVNDQDRKSSAVIAMAIINMAVMAAEWFRPSGPMTVDEVANLHAELAVRIAVSSLPTPA